MMEDKERIIVDGVDFGTVVHFPRILRSAVSALQPGRMALGLLIITALIVAGRLWDGAVAPSVPPGGLLAAPWSDTEVATAQGVLRRALETYESIEQMPAAEETLEARVVGQRIVDLYEQGAESAENAGLEEELRRTLVRVDAVRLTGEFEATAVAIAETLNQVAHGVLTLDLPEVWGGLSVAFYDLPTALWARHKTFTVVYGLIALIVLALGGGALSRMAACQWAGHERLPVSDAIDFAGSSWQALVLAPIWPLVLIVVAGFFAILCGALVGAPWGLAVLGSFTYLISVVLGALVAFLLMGYLAGLPLLIPAVACEHCDGPDADQRAFAYVLNRPLHLAGYTVVVLIGLVLGYAAVSWFVATALNASGNLAQTWAGDAPALADVGGHRPLALAASDPVVVGVSAGDRIAIGVVRFWHTIARCLVPAYVLSYLFTAWTYVYLLLRQSCDGQDIQEIWRPGLIPGTLTPEAE